MKPLLLSLIALSFSTQVYPASAPSDQSDTRRSMLAAFRPVHGQGATDFQTAFIPWKVPKGLAFIPWKVPRHEAFIPWKTPRQVA